LQVEKESVDFNTRLYATRSFGKASRDLEAVPHPLDGLREVHINEMRSVQSIRGDGAAAMDSISQGVAIRLAAMSTEQIDAHLAALSVEEQGKLLAL